MERAFGRLKEMAVQGIKLKVSLCFCVDTEEEIRLFSLHLDSLKLVFLLPDLLPWFCTPSSMYIYILPAPRFMRLLQGEVTARSKQTHFYTYIYVCIYNTYVIYTYMHWSNFFQLEQFTDLRGS